MLRSELFHIFDRINVTLKRYVKQDIKQEGRKYHFPLVKCDFNIANLLRDLSHLKNRCTFALAAILHFMRFRYLGVATIGT